MGAVPKRPARLAVGGREGHRAGVGGVDQPRIRVEHAEVDGAGVAVLTVQHGEPPSGGEGEQLDQEHQRNGVPVAHCAHTLGTPRSATRTAMAARECARGAGAGRARRDLPISPADERPTRASRPAPAGHTARAQVVLRLQHALPGTLTLSQRQASSI